MTRQYITRRARCSAVRPTDLVSLFAPAMAASGAEWMIVGGVAAIIYGEPRLTQDIDLVAALREEDAPRFAAQFPSTDFYCPPVEAIAREAGREAFEHFSLLHLESDARADVYLAGTDPLVRVLGDSVDLAALERDAGALGLSVQWREMEALRE
jgi:hypothetical protein